MVDISLICVGIQTSGNLGALARLCSNFDATQLIAIDPKCAYREGSPAYGRATKMGRKYLDNLIIVDTLEEARDHVDILIGLSARKGLKDNLSRPATSIQGIGKEVRNYTGNIGLLLGREDSGLTNEEVAQCDILTTIPIQSDNPVLNISHAANIALWEFTRELEYSNEKEKEHRVMKRAEKEVFLEYLSNMLQHTWLDDEKKESTNRVFRTLLSRSLVTNREAPALVGTMRYLHQIIMEGHVACEKNNWKCEVLEKKRS